MNKYEEMDAQPAMYWSFKKPMEQEIKDNLRAALGDNLFDFLEAYHDKTENRLARDNKVDGIQNGKRDVERPVCCQGRKPCTDSIES